MGFCIGLVIGLLVFLNIGCWSSTSGDARVAGTRLSMWAFVQLTFHGMIRFSYVFRSICTFFISYLMRVIPGIYASFWLNTGYLRARYNWYVPGVMHQLVSEYDTWYRCTSGGTIC